MIRLREKRNILYADLTRAIIGRPNGTVDIYNFNINDNFVSVPITFRTKYVEVINRSSLAITSIHNTIAVYNIDNNTRFELPAPRPICSDITNISVCNFSMNVLLMCSKTHLRSQIKLTKYTLVPTIESETRNFTVGSNRQVKSCIFYKTHLLVLSSHKLTKSSIRRKKNKLKERNNIDTFGIAELFMQNTKYISEYLLHVFSIDKNMQHKEIARYELQNSITDIKSGGHFQIKTNFDKSQIFVELNYNVYVMDGDLSKLTIKKIPINYFDHRYGLTFYKNFRSIILTQNIPKAEENYKWLNRKIFYPNLLSTYESYLSNDKCNIIYIYDGTDLHIIDIKIISPLSAIIDSQHGLDIIDISSRYYYEIRKLLIYYTKNHIGVFKNIRMLPLVIIDKIMTYIDFFISWKSIKKIGYHYGYHPDCNMYGDFFIDRTPYTRLQDLKSMKT